MTTVRGYEPDHWEASLEDLLAEPPPGDHAWITAVSRRLVAAHWTAGVEGDGIPGREWPCHPGLRHELTEACPIPWVGTPRPRLVVVGESTSREGQVPFHARAGTWLWAALRSLGWDELECLVTNAQPEGGGDPWPAEAWRALRALLPRGTAWLAVGREAGKVLAAAKIKHACVVSPAWHKQYAHAEGVAGFAKRIAKAGLRNAPGWKAEPLPWRVDDPPDARAPRVDTLPALEGPAGRVPASVAHRRAKDPASVGVDPVKLDNARRLYVTGAAESVSEAANQAGTDPSRTRKAARIQGWKAERSARVRAKGQRWAEKYEAEEMAGLARSKLVALNALQTSLQGLQTRLAAAHGEPNSIAKLAQMRAAGDKTAVPYHATPSAVRAIAQALAGLRRERVIEPPAEPAEGQ